MARAPMESVAEAQRRAERRLPKPVYSAILAGRERGVTTRLNLEAFDEIGLRTRLGVDVPPAPDMATQRPMSTTLLGQELSLPVVLSPVGVQAIDPGGELPAARAAAKAGTAIAQSNFASKPFEELVAANPKAFFQLQWVGTREEIEQRVERMRRAGAAALILTIDAMPSFSRDWGSPLIPDSLDLRTLVRFAPMGLSRPAWVWRFMRNGGLPDLGVPNLGTDAHPRPTFMSGFGQWLDTPLPTWDDVRWLAELWGGPFMVKGIMTADDARRAVDAGATAISVSNHGGNNMDSTPSALRALPGIAGAVGDQVEVAYDGGIRRGGDVVKALALGACAVLIGRAYLFGLAADGERGVTEVIEILRAGIDLVLKGIGRASTHDLSPEDLYIPDGFTVT